MPAAEAARVERAIVHGLDSALKRAIDILLALGLLILLAPLCAVVAVAIRLDSPGPAIFRQRRVGRNGEAFTMLKFRSMLAGATDESHRGFIAALAAGELDAAGGDLWKLTGDRRVTRVGGLIRKASIDEVPQLLNVLAGQMSFVGPRPALEYELDHYSPEDFDRFTVRPGITGLWQVSGRNRLGFKEMLELDLEYVARRSLAYDLALMARTPLAVLRADAA